MILLSFMRYALVAVVLRWMTALVPLGDHTALAWAIGLRAQSRAEAALAVAVAFRESSFDNAAIGDHGRSVCAFQIHNGDPMLLEDVDACVVVGLRMLRESVHVDAAHPVAFYARGPRWEGIEARRLSADRVRIAKDLLTL